MKLQYTYFFASLGFIKAQDFLFAEPTACTTPNKDVGICVEIRNCAIFVQVLRSQRKESYDFLRASQCGTSEKNQNPKVCCGKHNSYVMQALSREFLSSTSPLSLTCGGEVINAERVIGGNEVKLGEFPWMARLRHRRDDGLFTYGCVGFLISEKFVLTAAHCVESTALTSLGSIYQVQLGEHNTETDLDCTEKHSMCADPPQYLTVDRPIVHPDYSNNKQYHNDIAIIPLKEAAVFSDFVSAICLAKTPSAYNNFVVSGWGRTELRNSSPVKKAVSLPRADWTQCSGLYKTRGIRLLDSQVCAGGEAGKDSCTGDSGGPLMVLSKDGKWYAEGIVSSGKACGEQGWPGIYTNIPKYLPWIELVMNQYLGQHRQ